MTDLDRKLTQLNEDQVLESTLSYLSQRLHVDDPGAAPQRVLELLGTPSLSSSALRDEAERAAREDTADAMALMRVVLRDAAARSGETTARLDAIVDAAGSKQCIVSPNLIALGIVLVVGYLAAHTKGRASETIEVTREEGKDGRIKVTAKAETKYINPLSVLGTLLEHYFPTKGA